MRITGCFVFDVKKMFLGFVRMLGFDLMMLIELTSIGIFRFCLFVRPRD